MKGLSTQAAITDFLLPLTALRQLTMLSCRNSGEAQGVTLNTYRKVSGPTVNGPSTALACLRVGWICSAIVLQPPRAAPSWGTLRATLKASSDVDLSACLPTRPSITSAILNVTQQYYQLCYSTVSRSL